MNEYPRMYRGLDLVEYDNRTQYERKMPADSMHCSSMSKRIRKIKTRADIATKPWSIDDAMKYGTKVKPKPEHVVCDIVKYGKSDFIHWKDKVIVLNNEMILTTIPFNPLHWDKE